MQVYSDASWGDCPNGKSTTGFVVYLYGALVMWNSVKQSLVATNTCEAEFAALSECVVQLECFFPAFTGTQD